MQRRLVSVVGRSLSKANGASSARLAPVARSMSTFDKKERGEEARYFAAIDAQKKAEMRAKLDALMESDDAEAHIELMEALGKYSILFFHS